MGTNLLGANLRFLRKSKGMSQQALAEAVGLKRNNIASYEAGIADPKAVSFLKLANFFKISPIVLLEKDLSANRFSNGVDGRPNASSISELDEDLQAHLEHLMSKTHDMEKVLEGFREFYKYRRKIQEDLSKETISFASDFEGLITMLEELLKTNRTLFEVVKKNHEQDKEQGQRPNNI